MNVDSINYQRLEEISQLLRNLLLSGTRGLAPRGFAPAPIPDKPGPLSEAFMDVDTGEVVCIDDGVETRIHSGMPMFSTAVMRAGDRIMEKVSGRWTEVAP